MDKGAGGRMKRILSWILAALIITGGAIAIGWFAGIALVDLMQPGSKDLAEQMDELNAEAGEAPGSTDIPAEGEGAPGQEAQGPQLSLPAIMDEAFDTGQDDGSSPFASPPWANNVSITPIDEAEGDQTDASTGEEPAADDAAEEPLGQQAPPANEPSAQAPKASQAPESSTAPVSSSQPSADAGSAGSSQEPSQQTMYKVRVGPYSEKAGADESSVKLKEMGFPVLTVKEGTSYFVQIGAFSVWANADSLVQKVKAAGFAAKIAN